MPRKRSIVARRLGINWIFYIPGDARTVVENKKLIPNIPVDKYVETILAVKTEALKRSDVLELMTADNMNNVGGFGELKEWVAKRKHAFGREARLAGVDRPRGFMLVGPPGTAKSLVAKATANELGLSLIKFDISRVYSSLVGSTETRVRTALKTLEAMAPAVVLVDAPVVDLAEDHFRRSSPKRNFHSSTTELVRGSFIAIELSSAEGRHPIL